MRNGTGRAVVAAMVGLAVPLLGMGPIASAASGPSARPGSLPGVSGPADDPVIVVLGGAAAVEPDTAAGSARRDAAAATAEAPLLSALGRSHATHVHPLHLVDAVVATVSPAEAAALARTPGVARVVPDVSWRLPQPTAAPSAGTGTGTGSAAVASGACPLPGFIQLDPEGVEAVKAVDQDPDARTARSLGFDGAGVTVGDMAVGIDPTEAEMIRPDGQRVIAHYVDFTGEGTEVQGGEDLESYLDDSVMAAQGAKVYDLHDFTPGMPKGCDIRLQGVAPGITIDAYKVYGDDDQTTLSAFVESVDYAVDVDHVDVLNEEGGSFPFPDTAQDLLKQVNDAAIAAGVTLTSPSYDAGPEDTIWNPSTEAGVISTGASTVFRSYAQDDVGGFDASGATGWISDNVSSLSSGGATEGARSIDVVAPGDLDWVACQPGTVACGKDDLVLLGGTSEAGPITAAVAALVIQAYRSTHDGASPTPALVSHIISSSADDLGLPGSIQGSGLVDAYRAVEAAEASRGSGAVVADTQQLSFVGEGGGSLGSAFGLRNDSASPVTVHLAGRTTGTPSVVLERPLHLALAGTSSTRLLAFSLAAPTPLLTADVAAPGGGRAGNAVAISLVEPNGRFVAYSLPNGDGDHGQVEVRNAPAGRWTMVVSSDAPYTGPAAVEVTATPSVAWGVVSPSSVTLAPHASTEVSVRATYPATPGDTSDSIAITTPSGASSIPVTVRTLVPITDGAGSFSGTLVGGNGRGGVPAQTFFYQWVAPAGQPALSVAAVLGGHRTDAFCGFLVAPDGDAVAQDCNQLLVGEGSAGPVTVPSPGVDLHALAPSEGVWTVILTFSNPVRGTTLTDTLDGRVSFAPMPAGVTGLPDRSSDVIAPGASRVVAVTVRNPGPAPESYFLDARLDHTTTLALPSITPSKDLTLPLTYSDDEPEWIVPTGTTALTGAASSSAPTTFDMSPLNGDPDTYATVDGDAASDSVAGEPLTQGAWDIEPQPIGPFGSGGAAPSTTTLTLTATTLAFDAGLTPTDGDLWATGAGSSAAFTPVVVQPGRSGTLYAVLSPVARAGTVVTGTLYLDDSAPLTVDDYPSPSGDEITAVPYTYTVGR